MMSRDEVVEAFRFELCDECAGREDMRAPVVVRSNLCEPCEQRYQSFLQHVDHLSRLIRPPKPKPIPTTKERAVELLKKAEFSLFHLAIDMRGGLTRSEGDRAMASLERVAQEEIIPAIAAVRAIKETP